MRRKQFIQFIERSRGIVSSYRSQAPLGFDPQNAATAINGYSTELAQVQPPSYSPLKPNQMGGRLRVCYFTLTFASQASGTNFALAVLPKGARIITGDITVSATMGTCTFALGLAGKDGSGFIDSAGSTSDSINNLLAAVALTTTAKTKFAETQALNYGFETGRDCYLTLTLGTAAAGTQVLQGHVTYVVD